MRYLFKFILFVIFGWRKKKFNIPERLKNNKDFKVKFSSNGEIQTYIKGCKYPYPGFPTTERTEKLHSTKSMLPMAIEAIYKGFVGSKTGGIDVVIKDQKYYWSRISSCNKGIS